MRRKLDVDGDGKITQKDVSIYKQLEEIDASKAKRNLKRRLIYGVASVVGIVILASLFLPAEQVKAMTGLIDTILKYIPFAG